MKFAGMSAPIEVDATNVGTGTWELLTYDFSAAIGNTYNKLIIFILNFLYRLGWKQTCLNRKKLHLFELKLPLIFDRHTQVCD